VQAVYRYWAAIVFLAIVVQVGLAGYGAFDVANNVQDATVNEDSVADSFGPHAALGYLVILSGLVLFLIALAGRLGRPRIRDAGALFGLLIVQMLLAWFGFEVPFIGFFHPVNALVLFALSGWIARSAWRGEAVAPAAPPPAAGV
jgi:hypothetical protein